MLNLVANGPSGYNLTNSLRFRSSASASLNRTPASAGNRQKWTWSGWMKRGTFGAGGIFFAGGTQGSTTYDTVFFNGESLGFNSAISGVAKIISVTSAVFRDPSAWYHIVYSIDTTQATGTNGVKIYVNGIQQTVTVSTYTQNTNTSINNNVSQDVARLSGYGSEFFDGYLTEVNFVDGQALTPSSFGSTNATTGVWQPAKYTGTYGTNGFYLNFSSIALTSGSNTGLGKDSSGNGNYFNTNNISVTAGTTYDAMLDVPTLTSATVANYAVMSPIMAGSITVTDGNLSVQKSGASYGNTNSTIAFPTSGKYYFEATIVSGTSSNNQQMGMGTQGGSYYFVLDCYYSGSLIRKIADGVATTGYGTASAGTVIGVAVDADNGKAYLAINNTWIDSSSPTGGTGGYSMTAGQVYSGFFSAYNSGVSAYNFGQRPFSYTPPSGFVALNTYNLPTPTILQGNKYMDATLYTGNGSTQTITNAAGFKPDLVWQKSRSSGTAWNNLIDSVRGVGNRLFSNDTSAESFAANSLTSFNSNGFSIGAATDWNTNASTNVAWQWQAGQGSSSSNTSGSITSTVSVNTSTGFSVVTYTGTSTAGTIGHGLGVAPKWIIVKPRNATGSWMVYTSTTGAGNFVSLNSTAASAASTTKWNNTAPTSSVFSVGIDTTTNFLTTTYVAYCWAAISGYSVFGSYTGNGSTDGTFVYTGFKPKFVLVKSSSTTDDWRMYDSVRPGYNVIGGTLLADTAGTETTASEIDFTSNGFKLRVATTPNAAQTYIYAAFASNPFKNSNAN